MLPQEQLRHDIVNLSITVRILEQSARGKKWESSGTEDGDLKWLEAQTILAGIKHAHRLLQSIEINSLETSEANEQEGVVSKENESQFEDIRNSLEALETTISVVEKDFRPKPRKPFSFLERVPKSRPQPSPVTGRDSDSEKDVVDSDPTPAQEAYTPQLPSATDLLLDSEPSEPTVSATVDPVKTLLPPSLPTLPTRQSESLSTFQTSTVLHEDLADQLAQMAEQLKRNAMHFADSLAKDQQVIMDTEENLEKNFGTMKTERTRLRDFTGKSGGTTWLVLLSVIVVAVAWFVMFFVIRLT